MTSFQQIAIFQKLLVLCYYTSIMIILNIHYLRKKKFNIWLRKQAFLRNNIKQVCKKYGSSLRKSVALKEFIYDAEHQLVFCRNAKVGTTTWLASFLLISSKFKHLFNSDKVNTSKKLHMLVPKLF